MPKIVDHAAYRAELLERGAGFLSNSSFDQLSMRDLAGRLEVSTGTLYHYFPKKEDYLEALFYHISETSIREIVDGICGAVEPADRMNAFFDTIAGQCDRTQRQVLLTYDVFRSNLPKKILGIWRKRMKKNLRELIGLTPDLAELVLTHVVGFIYLSILTGRSNRAGLEEMRAMILERMSGPEKGAGSNR